MRKVEVNIFIQLHPREVISAFTEFDKLNGWWQVEKALIEPRKGGLYTLAWAISEKGMGYVSSGIIQSYQPLKELIIDNFVYLNSDKPFLGPMKLTVRVSEKSNGCDLYLCQDGYKYGKDWDWYYEAVKDAWPKVLETLKKYLEN